MSNLIAFHGKEETKKFYLDRVLEHIKKDELIRGTGWDQERWRGCAVGCTLNSYDHASYETELGIPEWLARAEDSIFEGCSEKYSRTWPARFLEAINPGANLEKVKTPFLIFLLESCLQSLDSVKFNADMFPDVKAAIEKSKAAVLEMIRCHRAGSYLGAAESAAWSAAASAAYEKYGDHLLSLLREEK